MIKPLGENILVQTAEVEQTTSFGIILPEATKEKPDEGKVVAVGCDVNNIEVDNIVMFSKFAGIEVKHEGKEYLIMKARDVYAVISV